MKFEIKEVIITPEYASELLKFNTNNRAVRQNKVSQLAESMNKGEWELSNDAIVVSEGNVLLNGQHRLLAVVKSGVSCPFILFTGAQDSAFAVMDTPALRRVSDVIARKGGKSAQKAEAAIAKYLNIHYDLINHWESIRRFSREVVATRKEMVAFYDKKSDLLNRWIAKVNNIAQKGVRLAPESQLAALAIFLEKDMNHDVGKIEAFIKALLIDGASQHKTILAVRKKFMKHKLKEERIVPEDVMRYLIRAWNDFLRGREVLFIKTDEDAFYFVRPY